jgi:hypothetical protein
MSDEGIQSYLKTRRSFLSSPKVYMITGLKIALGVAMGQESKNSVGIHAGIDASTMGVPVSVGPEASYTRENSQVESFKSPMDFVIGYSVIRIKISRKGEIARMDDYNKGATFL